MQATPIIPEGRRPHLAGLSGPCPGAAPLAALRARHDPSEFPHDLVHDRLTPHDARAYW